MIKVCYAVMELDDYCLKVDGYVVSDIQLTVCFYNLSVSKCFPFSDKSKYGFRMLEKMGWAEGKGLGVNEDGAKDHVKVSVKRDNLGEQNHHLNHVS